MSAEEVLEKLKERRLCAIVRSPDMRAAREAAFAVIRGGFTFVEITMTTPGAVRLIGRLAEQSNVVVGAGTVLTSKDAREAITAGARYIVSPVADERVIADSKDLGAVAIPGAFTPTEIVQARHMGADIVKLFPAFALGPDYVRAILGPLPGTRLMPTSGVSLDNFIDYLTAGAFAVGFVKELFDPEDMALAQWQLIEERARDIQKRFQMTLPFSRSAG